jgi:trehalose 6-phosphate phosphatase
MRAILGVVPLAADLAAAIEPLRTDPAHSAVLSDIDGTLAPIVRHAGDAHVPEPARAALMACSDRFGLVACVSGRRAADAKRMVGLGSIAYVGNHGTELLPAAGGELRIDPDAAAWADRVRRFADESWTQSMRRARVRREDKGPIVAVHWRGVPDERTAFTEIQALAERATEAGLAIHWGRKVLELRPPIHMDKGRGIGWVLGDHDIRAALYCGDDRTDVDAFRGLRTLVDEGRLDHAVCVGVRSEEMPEEVAEESDLLVDGTGGVRALLEALAAR